MLAESWSDKLISTAEAKIQSKVAEFLSYKEPLQKMTYSPNIDISSHAKQLLDNQIALEAKLQTGLAIINDMKTSGFDLSKSIEVGRVAMEMDSHMKQVKVFLGKSSEGQAPLVSQSSKEFLKYGVIGLAVFFTGAILISKGR
jgi:hypothetical protein